MLMGITKIGSVLSNASMWISGGVLASNPTKIDEGEIFISLPIFIISIIATASFTAIIVKCDNKRSEELKELREAIVAMKNVDRCKYKPEGEECPLLQNQK